MAEMLSKNQTQELLQELKKKQKAAFEQQLECSIVVPKKFRNLTGSIRDVLYNTATVLL